jgi:hypothetical protein
VAVTLAAVLALNTVAWGVIWIPRTAYQWIRVSPAGVQVLNVTALKVPTSAEVIASQGVIGRFSDRRAVYRFAPGKTFPVSERRVVFIIAPTQGIETVSEVDELAGLASVAKLKDARLLTVGAGIWAFIWDPPLGTRSITIPAAKGIVPAWALPGEVSIPVISGPESNWRLVSSKAKGYVALGDYFWTSQGDYSAVATMSSRVPVYVDVWNVTKRIHLAGKEILPTKGVVTVSVPVSVNRIYPDNLYSGVGPYRIAPAPPPAGNRIEILLYSIGGARVTVYSLGLVPKQ